MNFCKKINDEYFCTAKNRKQQIHCADGRIDQHDDCCQYNEGNICRIGDLIKNYRLMHEDELPKDITDELYSWWFDNSFVDGVRMGPKI